MTDGADESPPGEEPPGEDEEPTEDAEPSATARASVPPAARATDLPDGRVPALLRHIDGGKHTIVIDVIQAFSGDAAIKAAIEDGADDEGTVPNDHYERNVNPKLRQVPVADGARITVNLLDPVRDPVDISAGKVKTWAQFAKYDDEALGTYTMIWCTVRGGVVTKIEQQYLP